MGINHIELRHLRYFLGVAEEGSFTRAAARLHISQPPLSRQIKFLEEELDVRLFRRTKRNVALTEAGAHLLGAVRGLMAGIDGAALETQAVARGEAGELRIGLLFSASLYPQFSKIVRRFRARYPHVRLVFKEIPSEQALKRVYDGELDLSFQRPFELPKAGKILYKTFYDDYLRLCLSRHHPLARRKILKIGDLREQLLLVNPDQMRSPLVEQLQRMAHKAGFLLQIYRDTVNFPVIANLVAAGYGVAFLPPAMKDAAHGEVVFRDLKGLKKEVRYQPLSVAWRRDSENLALANFLEMMGQG